MLVRIKTHRLNSFDYGDIIEEESPRIKCLLENGEAELVEEPNGDGGTILAVGKEEIEYASEIDDTPDAEELPKEEVKLIIKKKPGRPKKVK